MENGERRVEQGRTLYECIDIAPAVRFGNDCDRLDSAVWFGASAVDDVQVAG